VKEFAVRLACWLLAALLGLAGAWHMHSLQGRLDKAIALVDLANKNSTERDKVIRQLLELQRRKEQASQALETEQAGLRSTLASREILIERLQHENVELRTWASVTLPEPVVRLRQHGAIIGAEDFRQRVPAGPALQPAGGERAH
jgi:LysB family phage lysis regulatory protein